LVGVGGLFKEPGVVHHFDKSKRGPGKRLMIWERLCHRRGERGTGGGKGKRALCLQGGFICSGEEKGKGEDATCTREGGELARKRGKGPMNALDKGNALLPSDLGERKRWQGRE